MGGTRKVAAIAAVLVAGLSASAPAADRSFGFQYVAHFVCGLNPAALPRVLPGQYATTVVLHNPGRREARASAKALLTFPPGGVTLDQGDIQLDPGQVASIDCGTLLLDPGPPPYTQGVVVITSNRRLDVRRIQTAGTGGEGGSVATADVASVPERRL